MAELSSKFVTGLNDLVNHRLTPALVDPDYFNATFIAAMVDAKEEKLFPINPDIVSHWTSPMDIYFNQKDAMFNVIVKVPAQRSTSSCAMFKLQPTPFSVSYSLHVE